MPSPSDYSGNAAARGLRWAGDALMPGNQLGSDGTLTGEGRGLLGLLVQVAGALAPVPGAGLAGRQAGINIGNNGNPIDFQGNNSRLARLFRWIGSTFSRNNDNSGTPVSQPTRQPIPNSTSVTVPDLASTLQNYRPGGFEVGNSRNLGGIGNFGNGAGFGNASGGFGAGVGYGTGAGMLGTNAQGMGGLSRGYSSLGGYTGITGTQPAPTFGNNDISGASAGNGAGVSNSATASIGPQAGGGTGGVGHVAPWYSSAHMTTGTRIKKT